MRFIKALLLIILFFSHLSCEKNRIENEEYKIISFFVNNVVPFPLPVPPPDSKNRQMSQKVFDSIMKKTITIGVFFKIKPYPKSIEPIGKDLMYLKLTNKFNEFKSEKIIDLSRIKNNENRNLVTYSNIKTYHKEFIDFSAALTFSRILFNEDFDKSIVIVSEYRSALAGSTVLYYLIKVDSKWKIYDKKTLEIS